MQFLGVSLELVKSNALWCAYCSGEITDAETIKKFSCDFLHNFASHADCSRVESEKFKNESRTSLEEKLKFDVENFHYKNKTPDDFSSKTFDNFVKSEKNTEQFKLVSSWNPSDDFGLLMTGPSGVGKSHLLAATVNKIINIKKQEVLDAHETMDDYKMAHHLKFISCKYFTVSEFLNLVKKSNFDLPSDLNSVDLIFLDDLGAENTTDWSREILFRLFDGMIAKKQKLVLTTNLSLNEIKEKLHERISSRILELTVPIKFNDEDFRIKKMKKNYDTLYSRVKN